MSRSRFGWAWGVMLVLVAGCGSESNDGPLGARRLPLAGDPCRKKADCNDGNPCSVDSCVAGRCAYANQPDGATCSDDNACSNGDACRAGACVASSAVTCAAPNQCQTAAGCDPRNGRCVYLPKAGSSCDDGDSCTQNDRCTRSAAGVCRGKVRPRGSACDDGNVCTTNDVCSAQRVCVGLALADGSSCDDGNPSTAADACLAGSCSGVDHCSGVVCAPSEACHLAGVCVDHSSGACSNPVAPDGTHCDDGSATTTDDACRAGVCTGISIGVGWVNRTTNPRPSSWPSARYAMGFAYDADRGRAVLFGGMPGGTRLNDTWEWDGASGSWQSRTPQQLPSSWPQPREFPAMTYDPVRHRTLLFGGLSLAGQFLTDTWEWDGASGSWAQLEASSSLFPPYLLSSMTYDANRARAVLVGTPGSSDPNNLFVFEWDSATRRWASRTPAPRPPSWPSSRFHFALAHDTARARTVLFGGTFYASPTSFNETWEWDGVLGVFSNRTPAILPTSWPVELSMPGMAYLPAIGQTLMFGGYSGGSQTWAYDGSSGAWTNLSATSATSPGIRWGHGMVYDDRRARALIFGGNSHTDMSDEVWEWSPPDSLPHTPGYCSTVSLGVSPDGEQVEHGPVVLEALASCSGAALPEYRFWVRAPGADQFQELRGWGAAGFAWDTSLLGIGGYTLRVETRAVGATQAFEGYAEQPYRLRPQFASIDAGDEHACAIRADGRISCWGDDGLGQASPPSALFLGVSAGGQHTCGLLQDFSLACWGDSASGKTTPPSGRFVLVSCGDAHCCAIGEDGALACWGDASDGKLAAPTGTFSHVSAGHSHSCAVSTGGALTCWGSNSHGQRSAPTSGSYTQVAAGALHSCALRADGSAACWGDNTWQESSPPPGSYVSLSSGWNQLCALRSDQSLVCWGLGTNGYLAPPAGSFIAQDLGVGFGCALDTRRLAVCWGLETQGQTLPP